MESADCVRSRTPPPGPEATKPNYRLVCALDFGTTYSGYAYSESADLDDIQLNKEWGNDLGLPSLKTSTMILTDAQGKFHAFGFLAENKYSNLCGMNDAEGMDLYKHFKMLLHNEKDLSRETVVTSTRGTTRPAFDIFTMALEYLKDHFLEAAKERYGSPIALELIRWVITVPAIWSDKAKQFMREAAHQAGLIAHVSSKQLLFALEPEAAALYCQAVKIERYTGLEDALNKGLTFKEGTKYMIIDAGGGTIDIAIQEILPGGKIKELEAPTGGSWGGKNINDKFEEMMSTIFGQDFIQTFKKTKPKPWLELEVEFEKKKRANRPDGESVITLPINRAFERIHKEITGNVIDDVIKKYEDLGIYERDDQIIINPSRIFEFYHSVFSYLIPHVETLLASPKLEELQQIFLVGGFAESDYLKKALNSAFHKYVVLTPQNSITAVLRGAVIYGHNPDRITSRIARKTYGRGTRMLFVEDKHDPSKKVLDENGKLYCDSIFVGFVNEGEEVKIGDSKKTNCFAFSSRSTAVHIGLYSSEHVDTTYVDEQGTKKLATIEVPMMNTIGGKSREIEISIDFGGTEITVAACDARGGKKVKAKLDFLADDVVP